MAFLALTILIDEVFPYWQVIAGVLGAVLLFLTCGFFVRSFVTLHRYTSPVNALSSSSFNVTKYKKSLKTMVIFLIWLLLCYIPLITAPYIGFNNENSKTSLIFYQVAMVVFQVHSCISPLIYIVRLADLRQTCKEAILRCC